MIERDTPPGGAPATGDVAPGHAVAPGNNGRHAGAGALPRSGVDPLLAVIARVRAHALAVWWTTMILGTAGVLALSVALGLALDQYLVLPAVARLMLLLMVLAAPIAFIRFVSRRYPGSSPQELALLIERRYPGLDNALINSLQLSETHPQGAERIVAAIASEAQEQFRHIQPTSAVSKRALGGAAAVLGVAALFLGIQALSGMEAMATGLNRMFAPFADNSLTRILELTPGDSDVLLGSSVELTVHVAGRVPSQAQLVGTYPDGTRLRLAMTAISPGVPDRLAVQIDRLERDLSYHVVAGDDRSGRHTLRVHAQPAVERIVQVVRPPSYIGKASAEQVGGTIRALPGSHVELRIEATAPFESGVMTLQSGAAMPLEVRSAANWSIGVASLTVEQADRYEIRLNNAMGFVSEPIGYDIIAVPDLGPQVSFVQPVSDVQVAIDARVMVELQATDDFGLRRVDLVQVDPAVLHLPPQDRPQTPPLRSWTFEMRDTERTMQRVNVAPAELGLAEDQPVVLQALAWDFNPHGQVASSAPLTIRLQLPAEPETAAEDQDQYTRVSLERLIAQQRMNIAASEGHLAVLMGHGPGAGYEDLPALGARQQQIRSDAVTLGQDLDSPVSNNPVMQRRLKLLAESLMIVAVEQLARVEISRDRPGSMSQAIETQQAILKELIIAEARQDRELRERRHREIAEVLAELIARQQAVCDETAEKSSGAESLGARQRVLAREAGLVQRLIEREAASGAGGNSELAETYRTAGELFDQRSVRSNMLVAATRLLDQGHADALPVQQQILTDLREIEALLRQMALLAADDELAKVAQSLRDVKDKVDRMTEVQQAITEIARELKKAADLRDDSIQEKGEYLKDLVEARENMADVVEQLAKDLHIHPDLAVSNDLLAELSEIYEQVTQREGSDDAPVSEIAVTRDESILAMIKKMQEQMDERLADAAMWLPDTPNTLSWQRENFDRDELGEIPLGDLPDALTDMIGDLLEQSEQMQQEALDSASNMHFPDEQFGEEIRDGDLPSWAAKGMSGNMEPQEMEQTGRSGAGRQGMSSGEIVGDTVKGLEGSDVHARRTNEGFQSGELQEEDPGAMDVLATGGGKMAGASPGEGMEGDAPARNELHYRDMARRAQDLERDAEHLYSMARLMRLPTGEMDQALLQMHAARRQLEAGDMQGFLRSQEQVVRAFASTHARLQGRQVVESELVDTRAEAAIVGSTHEPVPRQYEDAVAEYMRRIAQRR